MSNLKELSMEDKIKQLIKRRKLELMIEILQFDNKDIKVYCNSLGYCDNCVFRNKLDLCMIRDCASHYPDDPDWDKKDEYSKIAEELKILISNEKEL